MYTAACLLRDYPVFMREYSSELHGLVNSLRSTTVYGWTAVGVVRCRTGPDNPRFGTVWPETAGMYNSVRQVQCTEWGAGTVHGGTAAG